MKHNTLPIHPYLTDPRTGVPLQAVGIGKRGPIWPIMGAEDGGAGNQGGQGSQAGSGSGSGAGAQGGSGSGAGQGGSGGQGGQGSQGGSASQGGQGGQGSGTGSSGDKGFPENTPIAQMTDAQQAAYWKYHARQHEQVAKSRGDYDEMKRKAEEYDKHQAANATEHEKAVTAAADAARKAERQALTPQLVAAEFKVAAAGRISAEQLTTILEPLDMSKFLDANGAVDTAKVATFVNGIAPQQGQKKFPDLGQGRRPGSPGPSVSAGRDMYAEQQKNRPAAPSGANA